MSDDESDAPNNTSETRSTAAASDSSEALLGPEMQGGLSNEDRLQADKNATRKRR